MASILLSEADPHLRKLLVGLLERLGHDAIVRGGVSKVTLPADLLLLEPSSAACLEQAQLARRFQPALPVVCMSCLPEDASFLALGPLTYLPKPFGLRELADAIELGLAGN